MARVLALVVSVAVCLLATAAPVLGAKPSADLILTYQDHRPEPANTGDLITYFGGFGNAGPDAATDVRFQVALPAGLQFDAAHSSPNCSLASTVVTCTYASWPASAMSSPSDPTVAVRAVTAGSYDVTFTISSATNDPNSRNNTYVDTTTVVQPTAADLSVDVRDASAVAGRDFFYDYGVFNAGPAASTGYVATFELPAGLEFLGGGGCTGSGRTVTCSSSSSLPANAGVRGIWTLRAVNAGTFVISGSVTGNEPDPKVSNNTDSGQIVVASADADVSIDLQDLSQQPRAGETFLFGFGVQNAGPATATNVVATITLPAGLELVSDGSGTCTRSGTTVTCSMGSIEAGRGLGTIWTLRAADAGTYALTGSVTADQPDNATANNTDNTTITVTPAADIAVGVVDSMDPVKPGQGVTYTTTVTNNGPSAATSVTLTETWSLSSAKDIAVAGVTTSQGTCSVSGMRLDCALGTLPAGGTATVTVSLKSRGGGSLTMTANASATEQDPESANNTATETTTVGPK